MLTPLTEVEERIETDEGNVAVKKSSKTNVSMVLKAMSWNMMGWSLNSARVPIAFARWLFLLVTIRAPAVAWRTRAIDLEVEDCTEAIGLTTG